MQKQTTQSESSRHQVMRILLDKPEQARSMRELKQLVKASRSVLSRALSGLVDNGWISKIEESTVLYLPTPKGLTWTFDKATRPVINWGRQSEFRRSVLRVLTKSQSVFLTPKEIADATGYSVTTVEKFFDWACGLRLTTGRPVKGQEGVYGYKFTPKGATLAEAYLKVERTA